jgi:import inner membrane translocase subunit TIM9
MEMADQIKQFKDFLINYNRLTEQCFNDCVFDFTSRTLASKEDNCSNHCVEKFLKLNMRISQRFQEFQMMAAEKGAAQK